MQFSPMEAALLNNNGNDKHKYVVLPLYPHPPLQIVVFISLSMTWNRVTKLAYDDALKSVNKRLHSFDHLHQNKSHYRPCKNHSIQMVLPFYHQRDACGIVIMLFMEHTCQTPPMHPPVPKRFLEHPVLKRKNDGIVKLSYIIMLRRRLVRMIPSWRRTLSMTRCLLPWI